MSTKEKEDVDERFCIMDRMMGFPNINSSIAMKGGVPYENNL